MPCYYCEREFGSIPLNTILPLRKTKDHILPKSKGGKHKNNTVDCCHKCNGIKSNKSLEEFREYINQLIINGRQIFKGYTNQQMNNILKNIDKLLNNN